MYTDYRHDPYEQPTLTAEESEFFEESLTLCCGKGVFPYTWLDGPDKLQSTELPPRTAFYNDLSERDCSSSDYQHAINVFTHFEMTNMLDYTLFYLSTDILLLADVYESFREITLTDYQLDPARFHTAGALGIAL